MDDGGFGGIVGALLLWVQDAGAGDGANKDDGAAGAAGDHVAGAGFCSWFQSKYCLEGLCSTCGEKGHG